MVEVDDRSDNARESSFFVIEPPRKYEGGAALGASDYRLAHEQPRGRAVPLSDEVGAVGHIVTRERESSRAVALVALRVHNLEFAPLLPAPRTILQNGVDTLRRNSAAIAAIPSSRVEQQKIDGLQGPCGLLGDGVRHVGDFAIGGVDRIPIRAPRVVCG